MNLQNGYKVIYEKIADGKRTFYATKNRKCDPAVDAKIAEVTIGEYKLIYEKDGKFYGSVTGIPSDNDFCYEAFDKIFEKTTADVLVGVIAPDFGPHAEAITTNGDSHGKLTVTDNVVTLKATGTIKPKTNPNGNTYHHVGFKITAPEGIDPANVIITRPDGKTRVMANILDGANFTNMYWKPTEEDRVFTYYIDWNGNGNNDLVVIIDASKATLEAAPEKVVAE